MSLSASFSLESKDLGMHSTHARTLIRRSTQSHSAVTTMKYIGHGHNVTTTGHFARDHTVNNQ